MYFARGGGRPHRRELLERDLDADADVFADLGEREVGLVLARLFVLAQAGAAYFGEIAQDLAERVTFHRGARRAHHGWRKRRECREQFAAARRRAADAAQEALAPRRERFDLLRERRVVARQERLELKLSFLEHLRARADELVEVVCDGGRRCAGLGVVERIDEPASRRVRPARAQRPAHAAVQLRERDDGAGGGERIAQSIVVEGWSRRARCHVSVPRNVRALMKCYHARVVDPR